MEEADISEKLFLPRFHSYMKRTYQMWDMLPGEFQQGALNAIYQAIEKDFGDLLAAILDAGFSPDVTFDIDESSSEFVMDRENPPPNVLTMSALKVAVKNDSSSCVKILVAAGARIRPSECILFNAYENADFHTLALLLESGADPDERSKIGTPLLCACSGNHDSEVLELLLAHGASVHAADIATLRTPLHYAVSGNRRERLYRCAELLLDHGANPNSRNRQDETPAFVAAAFSADTTELILSRGGKINTTNASNSTALHHAFAATGQVELESVRLLVDLLSDLNAVDATGHTVLDLALEHYSSHRHHWDDGPDSPTANVKLLINHNAKTRSFSTSDMVMLASVNPHQIELIGLILNSTSNCNFITSLVAAVSDHIREKQTVEDAGDDHDRYSEFYDKFYAAAYRPRSLKHLCRCAMREHVGKQFANVVPSLHIPKSVISYLLLDDPCDLK